jgi:hypothetical protein
MNQQDLFAEINRRSLGKVDYMVRAQDLGFAALEAEIEDLLGPGKILNAPTVDIGRSHLVNQEWYKDPSGFKKRAQAQMDAANGTGVALEVRKPAITTLAVPTKEGKVLVPMNGLANDQLGTFLGIPGPYYDRLQAYHPQLLEHNVNTLLKANPPKTYRMVRTMDGFVRAFLSDSYETRDNWDLVRFLMPLFAPRDTRMDDGTVVRYLRDKHGQQLKCQFASCNITDSSLYFKIVVPQMKVELKPGATVRAGVLIRNSEVGLGSMAVLPFYEVIECSNAAYIELYGTTKRHVGRAKGGDFSGNGNGNGNDAHKFLSDATKYQQDKAFFMAMADVVRGTLTEVTFNRMLEPLLESMAVKLEGHPEAAVEMVGRRMDLGEGEQEDILRYLIDGGDLSIWGLSNAVTRYAQDTDSYDRATELEGIGGDIISLPKSDWHEIAVATKKRKPAKPLALALPAGV